MDVEDLLITDDSGPIGVAGVMGGASTEVSAETTDILIEAAHFEEVSIGRSRRRHKLPSEASKRFERGVDWRVADIAAQRAVDLLVELAGGVADPHGTDVGVEPEAALIELPADYPSARIGLDFSPEQIETSLRDLGASVSGSGSSYQVTAPSWRPDLETKDDLAEEIARLVGYDKIPSVLPVAPPGRGLTRVQQQRRRLLQALADSGLIEVSAYPFVSKAANELFGQGVKAVKLANPLSEEFGYLRTAVLPGLLEVVKRNLSRGFRDLQLFETGAVFLPGETMGTSSIPPLGARPSDEVLDGLYDGVPDQPLHLAAVLTGKNPGGAAWDYADALDVAFLAAEVLGVELLSVQGSHPAFHPGRTAQLSLRDGTVIGVAGELHPKLLAESDLPERTVAVELDADALFAAAADVIVAKSISSFPVATQDVALLVSAEVPAGELLEVLRAGAGELLEDVSLFDDYRGVGIPEGKKSLAFGLRFRADDRTLTAEEATEARQAAVSAAAEAFGAVLR